MLTSARRDARRRKQPLSKFFLPNQHDSTSWSKRMGIVRSVSPRAGLALCLLNQIDIADKERRILMFNSSTVNVSAVKTYMRY
jgi:hypothetical protein